MITRTATRYEGAFGVCPIVIGRTMAQLRARVLRALRPTTELLLRAHAVTPKRLCTNGSRRKRPHRRYHSSVFTLHRPLPALQPHAQLRNISSCFPPNIRLLNRLLTPPTTLCPFPSCRSPLVVPRARRLPPKASHPPLPPPSSNPPPMSPPCTLCIPRHTSRANPPC